MDEEQTLRTRNVGIRRVKVSEIEDAPWNPRTHPTEQVQALREAIDEIGFFGYPDVYETVDGAVRLIDGHCRKELLLSKYGPDAEIEVNVTDFDESQAKKATATKDPLAAMATVDAAKLDSLLRDVQTGSEALAGMFSDMATDAGIIEVDGKVELKPLDIKPPPRMSWVLLGIPTERFGEIAADIERLSQIATICESTVNDG